MLWMFESILSACYPNETMALILAIWLTNTILSFKLQNKVKFKFLEVL